jgi:hypothetical protein
LSNRSETSSAVARRRSIRKARIRDPHEHNQREDSEGDCIEQVERLERAKVIGGSDDEARTVAPAPMPKLPATRRSAIEAARRSGVTRVGLRIVLGAVVAELAPPHLLDRYMSLYGLSFTVGVALGPAVGGALLATSPDAVWWGGALALAVTGAGFLRLGHRILDPLL